MLFGHIQYERPGKTLYVVVPLFSNHRKRTRNRRHNKLYMNQRLWLTMLASRNHNLITGAFTVGHCCSSYGILLIQMLKSFLCCCCFTFHTSLSSLSFAKELLEIQKSLLTFPPCRQLCIFALGQKFKERCFNTSQALQASSTAFFNHRWHVLTKSVGLTILYQLRFCSSPVVCAVKTHEIWFVAVEQFFVFVLAAMLNYKSILLLSISVFYKVIWIGSIVNSTIKLHLELSLSRNSSVNVTVGSLHHSYQLGQ